MLLVLLACNITLFWCTYYPYCW